MALCCWLFAPSLVPSKRNPGLAQTVTAEYSCNHNLTANNQPRGASYFQAIPLPRNGSIGCLPEGEADSFPARPEANDSRRAQDRKEWRRNPLTTDARPRD